MTTNVRKELSWLALLASVILIILYGLPVAIMLAGSLTWWSGPGQPGLFSGLANFVATFRDPEFAKAILASFAFSVPTVAVQLGFALVAASATRRSFKGVGAIRALFFAPYLLPTVVVVVAWRFFSDPFVGLLPEMLRNVGVAPPDMRGPAAVLPVMIIVATYEAFPFSYVVLLARMAQIPASLYEVAALTGAPPWVVFETVTWPQIRPTLLVLAVLRFMISFLKFDVPWLVYANQAPSRWGDTLAVSIYRTGFERLEYGKAFAASLIFLAVSWGVYLIIQFRPARRGTTQW